MRIITYYCGHIQIYNIFIIYFLIIIMSEEEKSTKSAKETRQSTDSSVNDESYDRGDVAATEQKKIIKEAKE